MRVITAPEPLKIEDDELSVFLAGGIQKTEDWQKIVISELGKRFSSEKVVIFNPRRENFPIGDPSAAYKQIKWEYDALDLADVFTMYFSKGKTDEPICMYEYGKHLERRSENDDLSDFVVTSDPEYRRYQDVLIQSELVNKDIKVGNTLEDHINRISEVIEKNIEALKSLR